MWQLTLARLLGLPYPSDAVAEAQVLRGSDTDPLVYNPCLPFSRTLSIIARVNSVILQFFRCENHEHLEIFH